MDDLGDNGPDGEAPDQTAAGHGGAPAAGQADRAGTETAADGAATSEQASGVVAQLESDIASVASALETIDRIVAEDGAGPRAVEEIEAVVSAERFSAGDGPRPAP